MSTTRYLYNNAVQSTARAPDGADRPVLDEGVLDVAVRVTGGGGPASLRTQRQVSWDL